MELAREHRPLEAELFQLPDPKRIVNSHLGRGVQGDAGKVVADKPCHRQVLNDDPVHPHSLQCRENIHQEREFVLLHQGVEGYVNLSLQRMGVTENAVPSVPA